MSKLLNSLLLVALVVVAAGEKYVRVTVSQSEGCNGPEAWSSFTPARCLYYNSAYRYLACEPEGIRSFNCGTDSGCGACTQDNMYKYDCGHVVRYSCTDQDITNIYGSNSPVEFHYTQQDCSGDPVTVVVYNTSSKFTPWASCSNNQFYRHNPTIDGEDSEKNMTMACTTDPGVVSATERFCGWPNANSTGNNIVLFMGLYLMSFAALLL